MDPSTFSNAVLRLGRIVATANATEQLSNEDILMALKRHQSGDWGEVDEPDRQENELSMQNGRRVLSIYNAKNGTRFWVITEADRSSTTVLLPQDY